MFALNDPGDHFWTAFFANLPALVAALVALVGAVAAFVQSVRNGQAATINKVETDGRLQSLAHGVSSSHDMLNSQRAEMLTRIKTLEDQLAARDVADARQRRPGDPP